MESGKTTRSIDDVIVRAADRTRFDRAKGLPRWLVYGAGGAGRKWAACLLGSGRTVAGFIDQHAVDGGPRPTFKPADCPESLKRDCAVVIALHNPGVDVGAVKAALLRDGFRDIWLLQELIDAWPQMRHFWLAPWQESLPFTDDIRAAHAALCDEPSRRLLVALLDQRLNGAIDGLPAPDPAHIYCPTDLPRPTGPLRFIDCGAYTGDTVDNLRRHGYLFEEIAAFEPDGNHYAKLCEVLAPESASIWPCGVWDCTTQLKFVADDAASHISDDGSMTVQTVALDQAIQNFAPNFLKMDIEGAESKALKGAVHSIAKYRPFLAISAYHKPRDLWEILLQIKEWGLHYAFHLRSHSYNGFDTVLYAVPES